MSYITTISVLTRSYTDFGLSAVAGTEPPPPTSIFQRFPRSNYLGDLPLQLRGQGVSDLLFVLCVIRNAVTFYVRMTLARLGRVHALIQIRHIHVSWTTFNNEITLNIIYYRTIGMEETAYQQIYNIFVLWCLEI